MFRKAIAATATAAAIAVASLAATTGTASAYSANPNGYYYTKLVHVPKIDCEPVYRQVRWVDYYGRWHTQSVKVSESCKTIYVKQYQKVWVPVTPTYPTYYNPYSYRLRGY